MSKFPVVIIVFFLHKIKHCGSNAITENQELINSLNKELNIKHVAIIKDSDFQTNPQIFNFAKILFENRISTSFLSVSQMNKSMHDYYKLPKDYFLKENLRNSLLSEQQKKRSFLVYPPKTMVIITGENSIGTMTQLFEPSSRSSVTKYTWLILNNLNESSLKSLNIYIPYNCQLFKLKPEVSRDAILIEEIYYPASIKTSTPFNRHYATWKKNQGLQISEPDFYTRRFNLNGTVLLAMYKDTISFDYDIVDEISRIMNFVIYYVSVDNVKKNWDNWTTPIDIILKLLAMDYTNFYPFTIGPLWSLPMHIYIAYNKKYEQRDISPFLSPFSLNMWLAVIGWIISASILILFLRFSYGRLKFEVEINVIQCLFDPLESFLNQCGNKIPKSHSLRTATTASRLAALFIVPAYTGAILSFILAPKIKLPFKDVQGFVQDGSYQLGFINGSGLDDRFRISNDPWLTAVYWDKLLVPLNGRGDDGYQDGINRMCSDVKFAFMVHSRGSGDDFPGQKCRILTIPTPLFSSWVSIQLGHDSHYQQIFNRILKSFHSSGVLKKTKYDLDYKEIMLQATSSVSHESNAVYIENLSFLLIITGIIYVISLLILFAEIFYKNRKEIF